MTEIMNQEATNKKIKRLERWVTILSLALAVAITAAFVGTILMREAYKLDYQEGVLKGFHDGATQERQAILEDASKKEQRPDALAVWAVSSVKNPLPVVTAKSEIDSNTLEYQVNYLNEKCKVLLVKNQNVRPEVSTRWLIKNINCL